MCGDSCDHRQRPRDLALMLLAAGGRPPRQRARDQRADLVGDELRQGVLRRLVALDPGPDNLEGALAQIVLELGEPTGPARGLCTLILQEWRAGLESPGLWPWLIAEAHERGQSEPGGRGHRGPEPLP